MVAKIYCSPCSTFNAINVITVAPAPPETIAGRPPKIAVTIPIIKAPYKPTKGDKPAKMANESDSGIIVMATVKPANISFL